MLINAIIKKLKTSSFTPRVVLFGDTDENLKPPYVVVKPEAGSIGDTRQFRIIAHVRQGDYDKLDGFIFGELSRLLIYGEPGDNKRVFLTDDEGGRYRLNCGGYTDITTDVSDNTIFMERLFYQPFRL
jgi:hypothetical protein